MRKISSIASAILFNWSASSVIFPRFLDPTISQVPEAVNRVIPVTICDLTYLRKSYILGRWLGMAVNIFWAGPPREGPPA